MKDTQSLRPSMPSRWMFGLGWLLAMMLLAYALHSLLQSGYYMDDALNVQTPGLLHNNHMTVFQFTATIYLNWLNSGRLFPGPYLYWFFNTVQSLATYKQLVLASIGLNVILFNLLIAQITKNKICIVLSILLLVPLFQFRLYFDPICSFAFLMQYMTALLLIGLIAFNRYLKTANVLWYGITLITLFLGLICYEISYTFFILYFGMAILHTQSFKQGALKAYPTLLLTLFVIGGVVVLRHFATGPLYPGIVPGFNPIKIIKIFFTQVIASFPMSYYIFKRKINVYTDFWPDTIFAVIYGLTLILTLTKINSRPASKTMAIMGVLLIVCPSAIISLSSVLQVTMSFGMGYLPVYLEEFGVALVLLACILRFIPNNQRPLLRWGSIVAFSLVFTTMGLFNVWLNRGVIEKFNEEWKYPHNTYVYALQHHFLDDVPNNSTVLGDPLVPWESAEETYILLHRDITFLQIQAYFKKPKPTNNLYFLTHHYQVDYLHRGKGTIYKLFKVDFLKSDPQKGYILRDHLIKRFVIPSLPL